MVEIVSRRRLSPCLVALLLAGSVLAADVACPEIPGHRLDGQWTSNLGTTERQLSCDYAEDTDVPWPTGRLLATWQENGALLASTELCSDATQVGLSPLIRSTEKAAYVVHHLIGDRRTENEPFRVAAAELLESVSARATSCEAARQAGTFTATLDVLTSVSAGTPAASSPAARPPARRGPPDQGAREFQLGENLYYGKGVTKNYQQAAVHYRKGAELGNTDCMYSLAYLHQYGQGVPKDEAEAVNWARRAAQQNHPAATSFLGDRFYYGQGVPKDLTEAARLYRVGAQLGDSSGMYSLGYVLDRGQGTGKDENEAIEWFRKASAKGHRQALHELAEKYYYGRGVALDFAEAARLYRQAADKGVAASQYSLGYIYDLGKGVGKNRKQAIEWYQKAARQGHKAAQTRLTKLGQKW